MNINLRQLRAFVTIGRLGSFTRAAHALNATQPALSTQVRDLEQSLGVRLFDRSTRSVTLTQAGKDLLPSVDAVLGDIGSVVDRARDVAKGNIGRVSVAALPSLSAALLPDAVARLQRVHPSVTVVIRDALAERSLSLLRADEVDLALTSAPPPNPQLHFTPLLTDHMVAVLPHNHPSAGAKSVRLADLLEAPLVLMDRDSSVRRSVDTACASIGRMAAPVFEVAFMATAIGLARAGLGATLLPSSAADLRAARDLIILDLEEPRIERQLGILKQRRRAYSPAAEAFVEVLREVARVSWEFFSTRMFWWALASRGLRAEVFELVLRTTIWSGRNVLRELEKALREKIKLPFVRSAEIVDFVSSEATQVVDKAQPANE